MKSLAIMLLACLRTFAQEPCQTSAEMYAPAVESIMRLPEGTSISWLDKHVARLGDGAGVALIRLGAPKKLKDPADVRKALYVLRTAFDCPLQCIVQKEDRTAAVSMLLLDAIEDRQQDAQLKKQIAETRDYIRSQLHDAGSP